MEEPERSYHHGHLRRALVEEGLRLARGGGMQALGLREVTRSVGVTANAAYRHFGDHHELVVAIAFEAQQILARQILATMDATPAAENARALQRFRGFCQRYIEFAISEHGWFELACYSQHAPEVAVSLVTDEAPVPPPYVLLIGALDELVVSGRLSPDHRPNAEWVCWSAIQGFAELTIKGPLQGQERARLEGLGSRVVEVLIGGLGISEAG